MAEVPVYWFVQQLSDCAGDNNWLSRREKSVLDGLVFTKRRSDWRLGRWTAKQTVLRCCASERALNAIEILARQDGSPQLFLNNRPAEFSISISHSHHTALCAVDPSGAAVGCDLEFIEPRSETFIADYFTEQEMAWVRSTRSALKDWVTNLIWSAKESALKVLKEGLRMDTRLINVEPVNFDPSSAWQPFEINIPEQQNLFGVCRSRQGFVLTIVSQKVFNPRKVL